MRGWRCRMRTQMTGSRASHQAGWSHSDMPNLDELVRVVRVVCDVLGGPTNDAMEIFLQSIEEQSAAAFSSKFQTISGMQNSL